MSRFAAGKGGHLAELERNLEGFLPQTEFFPDLSPEEIGRFVALGEQGWRRFKAADDEGAETAFRAQIRIFRGNPAPYVSLAQIAAARGDKRAAFDRLHEAVLRGFRDLRRVQRSEAWSRMPRGTDLLRLEDAVAVLAKVERDWPGWDFRVGWSADDLDEVTSRQAMLTARIDAMAPALGPRLERLWKRLIDRSTAAALESWVERQPEAPDLGDALDRLMVLYAGGPLQRWQLLPEEPAGRLARISDLVVHRSTDGPERAAALVGSALARYGDRDKRGELMPEAARHIRDALGGVVTRHPDSPVLATAVVGLVRTEVETGHPDRAAELYASFRDGHADDSALLFRVQRELGELALRVGGLPEFQATTLSGRTIGPAALRGKVVVFDFWATWCPPCIEGFPALRKIGERHGENLVVVGVNLDDSEDLDVAALRKWIAREQVPGDHVHDGLGWDSRLVKAFGVAEIPFNVVVDADGTVVAVNERGRRLEKAVKLASSR